MTVDRYFLPSSCSLPCHVFKIKFSPLSCFQDHGHCSGVCLPKWNGEYLHESLSRCLSRGAVIYLPALIITCTTLLCVYVCVGGGERGDK